MGILLKKSNVYCEFAIDAGLLLEVVVTREGVDRNVHQRLPSCAPNRTLAPEIATIAAKQR